jgi:hypothetical protein
MVLCIRSLADATHLTKELIDDERGAGGRPLG